MSLVMCSFCEHSDLQKQVLQRQATMLLVICSFCEHSELHKQVLRRQATMSLVMCSFSEHSERQKQVLRRQATIAVESSIPLVIHSRDDEHDIIEVLEKVRVGAVGFLL